MHALEQAKLRRQNGILAGVCGGLAAFFGLHVFWFRLLFLVLLLPGGFPGLIPYLLVWLIVPADPELKLPSTRLA